MGGYPPPQDPYGGYPPPYGGPPAPPPPGYPPYGAPDGNPAQPYYPGYPAYPAYPGYPPQGYPGVAPPYPPPAPRRSRKKLLLVVVVLVVIVVALILLLSLPVENGSVSGQVPLVSNGQAGEGVGMDTFNLTGHGTVTISWSSSSSKALGGVVLINGPCTLTGTCLTALEDGKYLCISPTSGNGTTSGSCQCPGIVAGEFTVLGVLLSGYTSGDTITFTATTAAPLL